jgi:(p)ppGpp synthase/HD superfamily hydrolase
MSEFAFDAAAQDAGAGSLFSERLEHAIRLAARWHGGQLRKASPTPYLVHPLAVALILARLGFDETTMIAAVLHDTVEDTPATLADVEQHFGPRVRELVAACSEDKTDAEGRKRPWAERKRAHLAALERADRSARAIVLADKLHNLTSIEYDIAAGSDVWSRFNAERTTWLTHHRRSVEVLSRDRAVDSRIERLAGACLAALERLESAGE